MRQRSGKYNHMFIPFQMFANLITEFYVAGKWHEKGFLDCQLHMFGFYFSVIAMLELSTECLCHQPVL